MVKLFFHKLLLPLQKLSTNCFPPFLIYNTAYWHRELEMIFEKKSIYTSSWENNLHQSYLYFSLFNRFMFIFIVSGMMTKQLQITKFKADLCCIWFWHCVVVNKTLLSSFCLMN